MSAKDASFIVVDVETTGSHPEKNRLTEIACVLVSDGEIKDKFSSLINPHQFIPQYIANMTGISNEMAFKAPDADSVLPEARLVFDKDQPVFVAHNANFDWSFVQASFRRSKVPQLDIPVLCTLKLARKILPKELKKNVGSLADYFGVTIKNRHRALGDAEATAYILIELLNILERDYDLTDLNEILEFQNKASKTFKIGRPGVEKFIESAKNAPYCPGIYFFRDESDNILYIRQTDNLKEQFMNIAHEGKVSSKKLSDVIEKTSRIEWKQTPNVLSSLVLQNREIVKHKPTFNSLDDNYSTYLALTDDDFPRLIKSKTAKGDNYFGPFYSNFALDKTIENINKRFKLRECVDELKPTATFNPCFLLHIGRCNAPCALKETKEEYSHEVERVKKYLLSAAATQYMSDKINFIVNSSTDNNKIKDEIIKLNHSIKNGEFDSSDSANFIYVEFNGNFSNTYEVYFIKSGKLTDTFTIGKKSPLNKLHESLIHTFFNGTLPFDDQIAFNKKEINIINKWIKRNQDNSILIDANEKNEAQLIIELENSIRSFIL